MNLPPKKLHASISALLDETLTPEEHLRLSRALQDSAEARSLYFRYVDLHVALRAAHATARQPGIGAQTPGRITTGRWMAVAAAVVFGLTVGLATLILRRGADTPAPAVLVQQAGAKFYGAQPALSSGSPLTAGRDYALTSGMVHIRFSSGAEAVVEAPAVFNVANPMHMTVKAGRCSVHAEGPAEGFVVDTPRTRVIDRGTRFSVQVDETGDAVVQVTEGLTEVIPSGGAPPGELRGGMAQRFTLGTRTSPGDVPYDPRRFTARLPDRVVRYGVTRGARGGARELVDVTVQRAGRTATYRYEDLIPAEVTHFHGAPSQVHLVTPVGSPEQPARFQRLIGDRDLNTGLINPGGLPRPADSAYPSPDTPGIAVRFHEPVVNGDGPDIVFFELQVVIHPDAGDPFHVVPMTPGPGLRPYTVSSYDVDKLSPEALPLEGFRLYAFDRSIASLADLQAAGHNGGPEYAVPSLLLAVGIDLSDLGYPPGARVESLLFQDTLDDVNYIDPVLIVGLPPLAPVAD